MPRHTLTGNIHRHRQFPSRTLGNRRDILVYLPPGYRRFLRRRYPVFYLQDGQNLFDAATAFAGVEWSVDETAQRLIRRKLIEPIIIVAIANTGTAEPGWERARNLCTALVERGWNLHDDLEYHEIAGADHSEASWAARVDPMLRFLYPPSAPKPAR